MASQRDPDTAAFLQQFTNSVSRALHKQTCRTCNGREYTAGELCQKSNPGIFARGNHLEKTRPNDNITLELPPIVSGGRTVDKVKLDHWRFQQNLLKLSSKSPYEFEPPQRTQDNRLWRLNKLGEASPTKKLRKELNLPEKLDVTDKSGQNWQIVQEVPQQQERGTGRLKPVLSSVVIGEESLTSQNNPGSSGLQTAVPVIDAGTNARNHHNAAETQVALVRQIWKDLKFEQSLDDDISSEINRKTETIVSQLNVVENKGSPLNQAMKNGGISSSLTSLDTESKLTTAGVNTSRSLDLKDLYTRRDAKMSTLRIDVGGSLPDNFLHKNKEELRRLYPMYDWRIGMREPRGKQAMLMLATAPLENSNEVPVHASTLNLPANFKDSEGSHSKDNARFASKRHKKAAATKAGKPKAREHDVVTEKNEDTAMDVEPIRAIGNADDGVRPISGMVPKQPPPTPIYGRRKGIPGTVQIQF